MMVLRYVADGGAGMGGAGEAMTVLKSSFKPSEFPLVKS